MLKKGRGNSSKKGNTCGRGNKGQKSRSGYSKKKFFIGGQTPLNILFPKFGFKKKNKKSIITKKVFNNFFVYKKYKLKILKYNYILNKIFFFNIDCSKFIKNKINYLGGFVYEN